MQAALFGLFHLNWIQGIYAFALGIVLGYVCERGGSIYYSMGLHLLFNLWGTLSGFFPDPGNSVVVFVVVMEYRHARQTYYHHNHAGKQYSKHDSGNC